jgi:ABC-type Fe3+ transport system permease subunit
MAAAVVGVVVLALPLVYLLVRVLDAGDAAWAALWRTRTLDTLLTSVMLVALVAVGTLVLAAPTAWLLSRTRLPLSRTFVVLTALPLAVPSYVAAYAWIALFPGMDGIWAAALVMSLCTFPYVCIPLLATLRGMDAGPEQVARSMGLTRTAVLRRVVAPMAWPAAGAGLLLVAFYTLAEFGTVSIFRVDAFTRVIYASYRASFDRTAAAVLAVLLVVLALILVAAEARARGRAARWRIGPGAGRPVEPIPLTGIARVLGLTWLLLVTGLALVLPLASIAYQLFSSQRRAFDPSAFAGALAGSVSSSSRSAWSRPGSPVAGCGRSRQGPSPARVFPESSSACPSCSSRLLCCPSRTRPWRPSPSPTPSSSPPRPSAPRDHRSRPCLPTWSRSPARSAAARSRRGGRRRAGWRGPASRRADSSCCSRR